MASGQIARHDLTPWGANGALLRAQSDTARSKPMAVPVARPDGESVVGLLRRSARAVQILVAATILIGGITTYAIVGVLRPRVESLNAAVAGLNQAAIGMEQARFALTEFLATGDRSDLASYSRSKAIVAAGDAEVLRSGLGGHDVLAKLLAVRSAEQAWTTGWADLVITGAETGTSAPAGFEAQGTQLFSAYLSSSSQATTDLGAKARAASADEWKAVIAGFAGSAVLIAAAGALAADHRRLAAKGLRSGVAPLVAAARRIEAGEEASLDGVEVPAELEELARVVLGMARELASLREAIDMSAAQANARAGKLLQVLELTRSIGGNLSLRPVMESVASAALRLSGAARAVLWISVDGELRPLVDTGGGPPVNGSEPPDGVVQAATYGRSTRSWTEEMVSLPGGQPVVDLRDSQQPRPVVSAVTPRLA